MESVRTALGGEAGRRRRRARKAQPDRASYRGPGARPGVPAQGVLRERHAHVRQRHAHIRQRRVAERGRGRGGGRERGAHDRARRLPRFEHAARHKVHRRVEALGAAARRAPRRPARACAAPAAHLGRRPQAAQPRPLAARAAVALRARSTRCRRLAHRECQPVREGGHEGVGAMQVPARQTWCLPAARPSHRPSCERSAAEAPTQADPRAAPDAAHSDDSRHRILHWFACLKDVHEMSHEIPQSGSPSAPPPPPPPEGQAGAGAHAAGASAATPASCAASSSRRRARPGASGRPLRGVADTTRKRRRPEPCRPARSPKCAAMRCTSARLYGAMGANACARGRGGAGDPALGLGRVPFARYRVRKPGLGGLASVSQAARARRRCWRAPPCSGPLLNVRL